MFYVIVLFEVCPRIPGKVPSIISFSKQSLCHNVTRETQFPFYY